MSNEDGQEISLGDAANELGVTRATLYYYMRVLKIETNKYPLDKKAYIPLADFGRIKTLRDQARHRGSSSKSDKSVA